MMPCAWDCFDAYLFDVDGTLLNCRDAVHYFAFCSALERVAGRPMTLEGVVAHGNTDVGILRDAFTLAGIEERRWRPRLAELTGAMCDYVQRRERELCVDALPGVRQVLDCLREKGAALGVATGNLRRIGEMKLKRAGLLSCFQFAGWSDGFESRADVFCAAVEQARSIAGAGALVCVVGDTPADIAAARANGLHIIAVATGIYNLDRLAAEEPDLCVGCLDELSQAPQVLPA
jgi:phosphoglycolate phosphatase-like HAD superfamily hydrolase